MRQLPLLHEAIAWIALLGVADPSSTSRSDDAVWVASAALPHSPRDRATLTLRRVGDSDLPGHGRRTWSPGQKLVRLGFLGLERQRGSPRRSLSAAIGLQAVSRLMTLAS
jgi:hypothetical protein